MHCIETSIDELKARFSLVNGHLINRVTLLRVGYVGWQGYRHIKVQKRVYREHRLIFAMFHNRWPVGEVDHINRIRDDNRPENLREVSRLENVINQNLGRRNPSGRAGVSWRKSTQRWRAQISVKGHKQTLGEYHDRNEAQRVYDEAAARRAQLYGSV